MVGVVCHEHVGPPRVWQPDELAFAGALADQVALVLAADERRRLQREADATRRELHAAYELARHDELTHLYNRRAMEEILADEVARKPPLPAPALRVDDRLRPLQGRQRPPRPPRGRRRAAGRRPGIPAAARHRPGHPLRRRGVLPDPARDRGGGGARWPSACGRDERHVFRSWAATGPRRAAGHGQHRRGRPGRARRFGGAAHSRRRPRALRGQGRGPQPRGGGAVNPAAPPRSWRRRSSASSSSRRTRASPRRRRPPSPPSACAG